MVFDQKIIYSVFCFDSTIILYYIISLKYNDIMVRQSLSKK